MFVSPPSSTTTISSSSLTQHELHEGIFLIEIDEAHRVAPAIAARAPDAPPLALLTLAPRGVAVIIVAAVKRQVALPRAVCREVEVSCSIARQG